jgi:hypothetical protein
MGNRLPTQASTVEVKSKGYAHLKYCIGLFFVFMVILFPFRNVFRPEFLCIVYFLLTSIFGILGFLVLPGTEGVLWYLGFIVLLILLICCAFPIVFDIIRDYFPDDARPRRGTNAITKG